MSSGCSMKPWTAPVVVALCLLAGCAARTRSRLAGNCEGLGSWSRNSLSRCAKPFQNSGNSFGNAVAVWLRHRSRLITGCKELIHKARDRFLEKRSFEKPAQWLKPANHEISQYPWGLPPQPSKAESHQSTKSTPATRRSRKLRIRIVVAAPPRLRPESLACRRHEQCNPRRK